MRPPAWTALAEDHPSVARGILRQALADARGSLSRAARDLGIQYMLATRLVHLLGMEDELAAIRAEVARRGRLLPGPPRHNGCVMRMRRPG